MPYLYLSILLLLLHSVESTSRSKLRGDSSPVRTVYYSAHSHNDYSEQKIPVWDAVTLGIGSIGNDLHFSVISNLRNLRTYPTPEADVYLESDGVLYIGHAYPTDETLVELYLDPLIKRINDTGRGNIFIDIFSFLYCFAIFILLTF